MKESRYSVSGAGQTSGIAATFCVPGLVHASRSTEPVAESASQSRQSARRGGGAFSSSFFSSKCFFLETDQDKPAHRTAKITNKADHKTTCSRLPRKGSTTSG